ncbi:MAG TPA: TonB-dependent receptor, partial [Opitutaceae bacterium]
MNTSRFMRRRLPAVYKSVAPLALSLGLAAAALAQAPQTGVISGRVYNPATGEYVRSAEVRIQGTDQIAVTDGSGYYSLRNAPAGAATVVVSYTGYEPTTNSVTVAPGGAVTQDFELKSLRGEQGQPIQLQTFTVSTEREGNAKAIMEQKVSMNAKTVMTSDSFGEIAEGNVGEFLKFMPGIQIDYVETDTRAARMGGLEARYGAVTLDGNSISNAGGASRQFEFEAASITNIEAIEINKTLSADMPANSPAGSINLRTKSALDRKGMKFNFTAAFIGNQYEHGIGQSARPDDGKHSKLRPTYVVDYSNAFFNQKVGVQLSG